MSGGLDSMLAVRLMQLQGVEVTGVHFVSVFNCGAKPGTKLAARRAADALGVGLVLFDFTGVQMEILKDPPHGFGSAANPCIDCHIAMLRKAGAHMRETAADFVVTGEVVGQRPMSQRSAVLRMIDRETGLEGFIVRPLSGKALPATVPEEKGLIKRELMEEITGRTRTRQMEMAREFGLKSYPSPAGGCLLTDPEFGRRVKDLIAHRELTLNDAHLIKVGRHYRLDGRTKVIIGRNERENGVIETFAAKGDYLLFVEGMPGPTALLRGDAGDANVKRAAALAARSSKAKLLATANVRVRQARREDAGEVVEVAPADDSTAAACVVASSEVG
jgi:tRNA U34 2-thiouridine synthase MnmA/TrmU